MGPGTYRIHAQVFQNPDPTLACRAGLKHQDMDSGLISTGDLRQPEARDSQVVTSIQRFHPKPSPLQCMESPLQAGPELDMGTDERTPSLPSGSALSGGTEPCKGAITHQHHVQVAPSLPLSFWNETVT